MSRNIPSERIFLTVVLLLAAFLRLYRLDQEGFGNLYYAAAVKSMLMSFKNFFYAAFDPGGFISVDKPPLGLWLEGLSVAIFGYRGWSLILPQAMAGVFSVLLMYYLVRRSFGSSAGLLAAVFLAITPIFVATNRSNIVDSSLILVLLVAVRFLFEAVERKSLPFLLLSMATVGIGFNIKMLQAYMILPAVYLTYLLFAREGWGRKVLHLCFATAVLISISLSWALIVDLTPKDRRPIVGNSENNSVLDLIINYNAKLRFSLEERLPASGPPPSALPSHLTPRMETGSPGIFRLFNRQLSGQISWFFPIILLGLFLWLGNLRLSSDPETIQLFLWLSWLFPSVAYFSFTKGLFHRYYLSMLSPPSAALAGIALTQLWRESRSANKWSGWLLPASFLLNGILQVRILTYFEGWNTWLVPVTVVLNLTCLVTSIAMRIGRSATGQVLSNASLCTGIAAVTFLPSVWALTPIAYGGDVNLPHSGPDLVKNERLLPYSPGRYNRRETEKLVRYLKENRRGEKYLVAVPSSILYGSKLIIQTGEPVMALDVFNGRDRTITLEQLERMVREGEVRFFLIIRKGPTVPENLRPIFSWVAQNGVPVPPEKWRGESPIMRQLLLYRCELGEGRAQRTRG